MFIKSWNNSIPSFEKEGYLGQTQDISLNESEVKDIGTVTMEQAVTVVRFTDMW